MSKPPEEGRDYPTERVSLLVRALLRACLTVSAKSLYDVHFQYMAHTQSVNVHVTQRGDHTNLLWSDYCYCTAPGYDSVPEGETKAIARLEEIGVRVYDLLKEAQS